MRQLDRKFMQELFNYSFQKELPALSWIQAISTVLLNHEECRTFEVGDMTQSKMI